MLSKKTKTALLTAFSIFFFFAVVLHIYEPIVGSTTPIWWHLMYVITYGVCWAMLFSKNVNRQAIFGVAALFPFVVHSYLGYQHLSALDNTFWVCILVCLVLPLGFVLIKKLKSA